LLAIGVLLAVARPAAALPTVPPNYTIEQIATGFFQPIALAFTPDGRALVTERGTGQVRMIKNDALLSQPVVDFATNVCRERGLIGIAVDPAFAQNRWVYVFLSQATTASESVIADSIVDNRVVRFTMSADTMLAGSAVLLHSLPTESNMCQHIAGNIHFGPDGYLLVSYGDGQYAPSPALDLSSERGKILRLDPETGQGAADNPFASDGDPATLADIWAYGVRNSFDFTVDRSNGHVLASENSNFVEDEVNWIVRGGDYGWPQVEGPVDTPAESAYAATHPAYREPIWNSGPTTICPTGIVVTDSARWIGVLGHSLLLAQCNPPYKVIRLPLGGANGTTVIGPAEDFATDFPYSVIDLEWDAQDGLWVSSFPYPGFVYRIRYVPATAVPHASTASLRLAHAGQNPARGGAAVRATVPAGATASLSVYDLAGRVVRTLGPKLPAGVVTTMSWDGRDSAGRAVRPGCYYVSLRQGAARTTLPVVLLE
jgi:glucose/arabinose dehydrogenase